MSINMTFQANVRGTAPESYGSGQFSLDQNKRGGLCVVQDLPPLAELVRLGGTWCTAIDTSDAFTYVNAWPTTRAELVLYNNDPSLLYAIDSAWMVDITSAAAAQSKTLIGQMGAAGIAAATDNTSLPIWGRSGKSYTGNARKAIANTAFAVANKWEVLATQNDPNTASIGAAVIADLKGGWIIPPGRAFCLAGVASTAAGTAVIGVCWHEVALQAA